MGSLAEELLENESDGTTKFSARRMLEEAAELFTNCLAVQQRQYEEMMSELAYLQNKQSDGAERDINAHTAEINSKDMDTSTGASSEAGEWATVEEAVTPTVMLETCAAQLDTLTTLVGLYELSDLSALEQQAKYISPFMIPMQNRI